MTHAPYRTRNTTSPSSRARLSRRTKSNISARRRIANHPETTANRPKAAQRVRGVVGTM